MIDTEKLKRTQQKIAESVVINDVFDFDDAKIIGGFSTLFVNRDGICSAVTMDFKTLDVIERVYIHDKEPMPYISGFRAFREGPLIVKAFEKLDAKPDVLLIDGHGIAHPARNGLATYVGIALDRATIGVAKKLLCGSVEDSSIMLNGERVGMCITTKKGSNPLFISPGHKISVDSAVKVVQRFLSGKHKLPEPLLLARRYVKKVSKIIV